MATPEEIQRARTIIRNSEIGLQQNPQDVQWAATVLGAGTASQPLAPPAQPGPPQSVAAPTPTPGLRPVDMRLDLSPGALSEAGGHLANAGREAMSLLGDVGGAVAGGPMGNFVPSAVGDTSGEERGILSLLENPAIRRAIAFGQAGLGQYGAAMPGLMTQPQSAEPAGGGILDALSAFPTTPEEAPREPTEIAGGFTPPTSPSYVGTGDTQAILREQGAAGQEQINAMLEQLQGPEFAVEGLSPEDEQGLRDSALWSSLAGSVGSFDRGNVGEGLLRLGFGALAGEAKGNEAVRQEKRAIRQERLQFLNAQNQIALQGMEMANRTAISIAELQGVDAEVAAQLYSTEVQAYAEAGRQSLEKERLRLAADQPIVVGEQIFQRGAEGGWERFEPDYGSIIDNYQHGSTTIAGREAMKTVSQLIEGMALEPGSPGYVSPNTAVANIATLAAIFAEGETLATIETVAPRRRGLSWPSRDIQNRVNSRVPQPTTDDPLAWEAYRRRRTIEVANEFTRFFIQHPDEMMRGTINNLEFWAGIGAE